MVHRGRDWIFYALVVTFLLDIGIYSMYFSHIPVHAEPVIAVVEPTETTIPADIVKVTEPIVVETTVPETTVPETTEPVAIIPEELQVSYTTWEFLQNLGYSDEVCAGILGNMMAECGGQTLTLDVDADGNGFYGICQWSAYYFPEVQEQPLEYQLQYLADTIESQFGGNLEKFVASDNPEDAALRFAIWYERCDPVSYSQRQVNARRAYEHFVGGKV